MTSLIAVKSDYIIKANRVYENLKEAEEAFEASAIVLDHFKCILARKEEIRDFTADGIYVSVYHSNEGYELYYLNYRMSLVVYDDMIVDYTLSRN